MSRRDHATLHQENSELWSVSAIPCPVKSARKTQRAARLNMLIFITAGQWLNSYLSKDSWRHTAHRIVGIEKSQPCLCGF
jgi:hypothetical protein